MLYSDYIDSKFKALEERIAELEKLNNVGKISKEIPTDYIHMYKFNDNTDEKDFDIIRNNNIKECPNYERYNKPTNYKINKKDS